MTCPNVLADGRCLTSRKPATSCPVHGRRRSRVHANVLASVGRSAEDAAEAAWWEKNRCVHRGDFLAGVGCASCRTTVPAYACELHGKCTELRRATDAAFRWCGACSDHQRSVAVSDQPPSPTTRPPGTYPVAIIITCHNYGRFLAECVESALATGPADVLIVDDASDDDTPTVAAQFADRGVRYLRVENRNCYRTRLDGLAATTARLVVWLDADDLLPADYLERGVPLLDDPTVGAVYSDMHLFGDRDEQWTMPEPARLTQNQTNHLHAACITRRIALASSDLHPDLGPITFDDWPIWRRLQSAGWAFAKSPAIYQYRRHGDSMLPGKAALPWSLRIGMQFERLTLFVPLSGRAWAWPQFRDWLEAQTWPRDQTRLVLCDTSQDARFHALVRRWVEQSDYPDVRLYQHAVARPGLADAERRQVAIVDDVRTAMVAIYRRMIADLSTDFVVVVEDDIIPPTDAIHRLTESMDCNVISVSGTYRHRFQPGVLAWHKFGTCLEKGSGVVSVTGNGFGCVLLRADALRKINVTRDGQQHADYDGIFYQHAKAAGWLAKLDWSVQCKHLERSDAGPTRFVVVAQPRTGSTLLCDSLGTHPGIWMRSEILNAGHGWNLPQEGRQRLRAAWQHDEPCAAAGFKLLAFQPWDHDPPAWATAWDELADDPFVKVIVLRRKDTLAQFASWKVANTLGRWTEQPQQNRPRVDVSPDELRWFRQWNDQLLAERLRRLNLHDLLDVEYETLCDDWSTEIARVQRFLGIDEQPLDQARRKSENRPLSETITTFDQLVAG